MTPSVVRVVLQTLSGESHELEVEPRRTVRELKGDLAERCGVPPLCQMIVFGTEVAVDSKMVSVFMSHQGEPLSGTFVISREDAYSCLRTGDKKQEARDHQRRLEALEALAHLVHLDYARTVAALAWSLGRDRSWEVRKAAAARLAQVARKGDGCAAGALSERLKSGRAKQWKEDRWEVRHASAEALGHIAQLGDDQVDCDDVRAVAAAGLARVAMAGDDSTVGDIQARMKDRDERVRNAAMAALTQAAREANQLAVLAAFVGLKDDMFVVRRSAVQALTRGWAGE